MKYSIKEKDGIPEFAFFNEEHEKPEGFNLISEEEYNEATHKARSNKSGERIERGKEKKYKIDSAFDEKFIEVYNRLKELGKIV